MRRAAALEVMPLDDALKTLAPAGADDIDALAIGEDGDADLIARLDRIAAGLQLHFPGHARRRHTRLLEVPLRRLVLLGRSGIDEPELHRFVAVGLLRLHLR